MRSVTAPVDIDLQGGQRGHEDGSVQLGFNANYNSEELRNAYRTRPVFRSASDRVIVIVRGEGDPCVNSLRGCALRTVGRQRQRLLWRATGWDQALSSAGGGQLDHVRLEIKRCCGRRSNRGGLRVIDVPALYYVPGENARCLRTQLRPSHGSRRDGRIDTRICVLGSEDAAPTEWPAVKAASHSTSCWRECARAMRATCGGVWLSGRSRFECRAAYASRARAQPLHASP